MASAHTFLSRAWHPFLFAAYPVFYLMGENVSYAAASVILRPLVVTLVLTALLYGGLRLIVGDTARAAVACSALLAVFFLFDLYGNSVWQIALAVILVLSILCTVTVFRSDWTQVTRSLNVFGAVIIAIPGFSIVPNAFNTIDYTLNLETDGSAQARPNIYYFILDGYGRQDILSEYFEYDNSPFLDFLREQDFHVVDDARSNYAWTILSLASSLNYEHATAMADSLDLSGASVQPLVSLTRNNRVMAYLRGLGYGIHGYMPGYMRGNLVGADYVHRAWWAPTEFESALLDFTPIPPIMWRLSMPTAHKFHYDLHAHTLNSLGKLEELSSPKFVFVHLLSPHPPFVFAADGTFRKPEAPRFTLKDGSSLIGSQMTEEEYVRRYRDQISYLDTRMKLIVEDIRREDPGAIIVLQGDHGPGSRTNWASVESTDMHERFSILNAVYIPDADAELRSQFQTPVNTFRLILNLYFDAELDLVPDSSYFTIDGDPYTFFPVDFSAED